MIEHRLDGCRPTPLAHYLKSLGVLRLLAEQTDSRSRGAWQRGCFVLRTRLDRQELREFFLTRYEPTPLIAPWNGGSGFYPKDRSDAIDAIASSSAPRLQPYRRAITTARQILDDLDIEDKVDKQRKPVLLEACRARLDDDVVAWLDSAFVLTADSPRYPPLLGTGGNDGRLDFTNNFMQRLCDVLDVATGHPAVNAEPPLDTALFDIAATALKSDVAIGQFHPAGAGGANAEAGFDSKSLINPWDFILMLEGAACFAAAIGRRQESGAGLALSYPFTVRQTGAGYGTAAADDESSSRGEIWLPLWNRFASFVEIDTLLSEGRAQVGGRTARNGVDFARAASTLGVDRGISSFQRIGFQVRNGQSYLATPLGHVAVTNSASVLLLEELDSWLDRFFARARGKTAPASVARAAKQLETAVLALSERDDPPRVTETLFAIAGVERALAGSTRWSAESFLKPVPGLSPTWLERCGQLSTELRLGAAIGSVYGWYRDAGRAVCRPVRVNLEPVALRASDEGQIASWAAEARRDSVWIPGRTIDSMNEIVNRRLLWAENRREDREWDRAHVRASLADVAAFIDGEVDDAALEEAIWACALIDWSRAADLAPAASSGRRRISPGADYALLRLAFSPSPHESSPLVLEPRIHRLAAAGRGLEATGAAARRLRARGRPPAVRAFRSTGQRLRRVAAALLIPVRDIRSLEQVLRPPSGERSDSTAEGATP